MLFMRRSLLSIALIGLLAILLAPGVTIGSTKSEVEEVEKVPRAPIAVQGVTLAPKGLRDEAAMVVIGTLLIGLGTAVRRAA